MRYPLFRLGARHISEGTDHLLFVLTLLLPAPLIVRSGQWKEHASLRRSVDPHAMQAEAII
ncbi:HupE/UreJ family protein [Tunturibacter empetritectus]|uniref:HupE/UreJ family protein n=1 Tax=Tunturiibacter empetritectus TaxID=3069691 RepID=A0AAU7Z8K9_9BACT